MHPFPPEEDLRFLVGDEVSQIALDPYGLQFRLLSEGLIAVEGRIEHVDSRGVVHSWDCQAHSGGGLFLHELLLHPIVSIDVEPLCLTLGFANGAMLRIFSELGPYERGHIIAPPDKGGGYFVF